MKYKIISVEKETDHFVVFAEFRENDEVVGETKQSFPLNMTADEIEGEIRKSCELYEVEREQAVIQKEKIAEEEKSQKVVEELLNKQKND